MITASRMPRNNLPALDTMEYLKKLSEKLCRIDQTNPTVPSTKREVYFDQILSTIGNIEENVCLVGYLDQREELQILRSFSYRGVPTALAESIIGNGIVNGSRYLVIVRNRKSGSPLPKSHDLQLINYLLSGLNLLGNTILDYIIYGKEEIFSAQEAGMLETG